MQNPAVGIKRIKVKVNFMGHLREIVRSREVDVELEDRTIGGLVEKITTLYGRELTKLIFKEETREFIFLVLLNGTDVHFIQGLDTELKEGDSIDIIPPVAGG